jgi:anhydro-N-acetylmuramic acid kinase
MSAVLRSLGLMSGTSMDGIDAAVLETDGERIAAFGPWLTVPYAEPLRDRIRSVLGGGGEVENCARELTDAHASAINNLLEGKKLTISNIDVIGFHGHTILHQPERRRTWQIGDGERLAELTGIDVIDDFRGADIAAGGQGAPLAPLYHAALANEQPKPLAVLNLGGVGNLTWIGDDGDILAFDTAPGNALIDDWVFAQTGRSHDADGALATEGHVDEGVLEALLDHPSFAATPPKSLDRDDFSAAPAAHLGAADGAATLTAFTAATVAAARRHLPAMPRRWLVCGGGRHNPALMAALKAALAAPVDGVEAVGWRGDALEAEAFAFLAVRSLRGLPLSLPSTTGVPRPLAGGTLHRAQPVAASGTTSTESR